MYFIWTSDLSKTSIFIIKMAIGQVKSPRLGKLNLVKFLCGSTSGIMKGWLLKNGTMYFIFDISFVKNEHILSLKLPLGKSKVQGKVS